MSTIQVARDIREENLRRSEQLSAQYQKYSLRVIGLLGSPGSGKTTLLENLLPRLMKDRRVAVIEGDIATDNDARRIMSTGAASVQITTEGACHLDASMVENALKKLPLDQLDLLMIENVGNLVCPVGFPLGEALRVAVISAAEGEDKPLKYPSSILRTDALVITKTDLAKYVHVDPVKMAENAKSINPNIRVFFSCLGEDGTAMETSEFMGHGTFEEYLHG